MQRKALLLAPISIAVMVGLVNPVPAAAGDKGGIFTPEVSEPSLPMPFSWTGFYAGAHAAYSKSEFDPFGPAYPIGAPTQNGKGWLGGAQAGFLVQLRSGITMGGEVDISKGQGKTDVAKDGNYITQGSEIDLLGSARARMGYAAGRWHLYGTGGVAWEKGSTCEKCPPAVEFGHCSRVGAYTKTDSFTDAGWVYGGGLEFKLTERLIARAEYLRFDFGDKLHELGAPASPRIIKQTNDIARIGLNFQF